MRLDTRLEQEGAEFLVLGHLLIEKIEAHKAYTRYPGFDLTALDPLNPTRVCRIQVKSRWATDYNRTIPIKNFDSDFVVLVALNRGYRYGRRRARTVAPDSDAAGDGREAPRFWVFPTDAVEAAQKQESKWGIVPLRNLEPIEQYENAWFRIADFLAEGAS